MPIEKLTPIYTYTDERLEQLRQAVPEAFADGKVNWETLREILGERLEDESEAAEHFGLAWPGKREARRLAAMPPQGALHPTPGEGVDENNTRNLFIEGENLEALKLLLKPYAGRVKMIYIDPPYNTGNDFVYKDDYREPLASYLQLTGQADEAGQALTTNTKTGGRYHSNWLNMIYPRLVLARQLLREDGVIFVSIDDHEVHNLHAIMGEVFGEECFKNCIVFGRGIKSVQAQFETVDSLTVGHEYVIMYSRSSDTRFRKLYIDRDEAKPGTWNNHWRGTDRPTMRYELFGITPQSGQWRWSKARSEQAARNYERMLQELGTSASRITKEQIDAYYEEYVEHTGEPIGLLRMSGTGKPEHYVPPSDTKLGSDLWTDISTRGSSELARLFGSCPFNNPKPTDLLLRAMGFATNTDSEDVILDFFAGSCSTAGAVIAANREDAGNRRFVMVQLPEPTPEGSAAREAGYETIAEIGKERIRRVIKKMKAEAKGRRELGDRVTPEDLGFRVFKLGRSNLRRWQDYRGEDARELQRSFDQFETPLADGWQRADLLAEVMLAEGFPLDSRVEACAEFRRNAVQRVSCDWLEHRLYVCLDDRVQDETIHALELGDKDILVCLDSALTDEAKMRLADKGSVKTI